MEHCVVHTARRRVDTSNICLLLVLYLLELLDTPNLWFRMSVLNNLKNRSNEGLLSKHTRHGLKWNTKMTYREMILH